MRFIRVLAVFALFGAAAGCGLTDSLDGYTDGDAGVSDADGASSDALDARVDGGDGQSDDRYDGVADSIAEVDAFNCDAFSSTNCSLFPQCGCEVGQACYLADIVGSTNKCSPPGTTPPGSKCARVDQPECVAGADCIGDVCGRLCLENTNCVANGAGATCARIIAVIEGDGGVEQPLEVGTCTHQCEPWNPDTCGPGVGCVVVSPLAKKPGASMCVFQSATTNSSACETWDQCKRGYTCVSKVCKKWCRVNGNDCASTEECLGLMSVDAGSSGLYVGNIEVGTCLKKK